MDPMDDNEDIFRYINEESDEECAAEITRLKRKRKGLRASLTAILNIIDRLITASKGADNRINRSESNRLAIERAFEKLEQRYDKLDKLNNRILSINTVQDDDAGYQEAIDIARPHGTISTWQKNTAVYLKMIYLGVYVCVMLCQANTVVYLGK